MLANGPAGWKRLLVLFGAMGSFISSTLLSERAASSVQERTRELSSGALPAIEYLNALRSELFRSQLLIQRDLHADPATRAVLRRELADARAEIQTAFDAYLALPSWEVERPLAMLLKSELRQADARLDEVLGSAEDEESGELLIRAGPSLDRAQATAYGLIQINADQASQLSADIDHARNRSIMIAVVLDALSVFLSVLLCVLAWRAVRYHMDTQEAQQRILGERAAELEAFAGRVAHDILNPLNAVMLALDLLDRGVPLERAVPRARASLGRVHRITDALLSFARAGARPEGPASCFVEPVLAGVIRDVDAGAGHPPVTVEASLDDVKTTCAACLPGVLASIAGNLVSNAIKYIDRDSPERRVRVRAWVRGGRVGVEVEDTGPGIDPKLQRTIFEPYIRGEHHAQPGIGLGLATAKRLCEAHGGHIGVRSERGKGSTFWFELPEASCAGAALPASGPSDAAPRSPACAPEPR